MSGRIRTIKPEMLEDAIIAGLSHEAFRLFIACILCADDYGNLRAHPDQLKGSAFWLRESREGVANLLEELGSAAVIARYHVRGQPYLHLCGWFTHQRVDKPGRPRVPGPKDPEAVVFAGAHNDSRDCRETVATPSRESQEKPEPRARTQDARAPDLRPPTTTTTTTTTGVARIDHEHPEDTAWRLTDREHGDGVDWESEALRLREQSGARLRTTCAPVQALAFGRIMRSMAAQHKRPARELVDLLAVHAVAGGFDWMTERKPTMEYLLRDGGGKLVECIENALAYEKENPPEKAPRADGKVLAPPRPVVPSLTLEEQREGIARARGALGRTVQ